MANTQSKHEASLTAFISPTLSLKSDVLCHGVSQTARTSFLKGLACQSGIPSNPNS
jgi:hypothetical protein